VTPSTDTRKLHLTKRVGKSLLISYQLLIMKEKLFESICKEIELHSRIYECDRELIILYHSFKYDEYFAISGDSEGDLDDLVYQFMGDLESLSQEDWLQFASCSGCKLDDFDEILFLNSRYHIEEEYYVRQK
jgi:hypothetical protein